MILEIPHVEKPVVTWADANGWFTLKINVIGKRGFPDHLFFTWPRVLVIMEFKRPGNKLDPLQRWVHGKLGALGWTVFTITEVQDGIDVLIRERAKGLVATRISGESDINDARARLNSPVPGPWSGEDEYHFGSVQSAGAAKDSKADASNLPDEGDV